MVVGLRSPLQRLSNLLLFLIVASFAKDDDTLHLVDIVRTLIQISVHFRQKGKFGNEHCWICALPKQVTHIAIEQGTIAVGMARFGTKQE